MPGSLRPWSDPFIAGVLALYTVLALAWAWQLPAYEAVDEQNHYHYMVFMKDQGRLPRQLPLPSEVPGQGHQPPLYYAAGALALKLLAPGALYQEPVRRGDLRFNVQPVYFEAVTEPAVVGPLRLLRSLQVLLLVLPSLALLAACLRALLPIESARLGLTLLALCPAFVGGSAGLNNDYGALLLGLAACTLLSPAWEGGALSLRRWATAGFVLGLAGLAKPTALGLSLLGAALLLRQPRGQRWKSGGCFGAALLLALAPWLLRNAWLYGDAGALAAWQADCPQCPILPAFNWNWLAWWLGHAWGSYWGVFAWMTWTLPLGGVAAFSGLAGLAGAGWFKGSRPLGRLLPAALGLLGVLALLLALALQPGRAVVPPTGRYFYVAALPVSLLLGGGLGAWGWMRRPWAAWGLGAALLLVNAWALAQMLGYYPN